MDIDQLKQDAKEKAASTAGMTLAILAVAEELRRIFRVLRGEKEKDDETKPDRGTETSSTPPRP